jgi:tetratricopeptide (TPR) repeat protein
MELKQIPESAIPGALDKALRYRLLNEPHEAESICRDILAIDPDNHSAKITMLLALTDQFESEFATALALAKEVLGQLQGAYDSAYYAGIIHERWANAQLTKGMPTEFAVGWYREAMRCYERAEALSPPDNPDAILRWNTCVRVLRRLELAEARPARMTHDIQAEFGEDMLVE